jgi:hypothetical protein
MPEASLVLANGTKVTITGTLDEIQKLIQTYGGRPADAPSGKRMQNRTARARKQPESRSTSPELGPDHSAIVNLVKTCEEAEAIEERVLRVKNVVNRTLLPLYIVHEQLGDAMGLTSGDVSKIVTDLGAPVTTPQASNALAGPAARYVVGDKVRKAGVAVRYKLNSRGVRHFKSVVASGGPTAGSE